MTDRAIIFVDGNNWYHGLKAAGVTDQLRLSWVKIARKLVGPRDWTGLRYYVGEVQQTGNAELYAGQRKFVARLRAADQRMSVHFGRLELRWEKNAAAAELAEYLGNLAVRIDPSVYRELVELAKRHQRTPVRVEKAVDVMLASDMVVMACRKEYDAAYLLSADGDYTHAVEFIRSQGLKVYAAAASNGAQLAKVVNSFIRLDANWFSDVYE